jgi:hypothetical protein
MRQGAALILGLLAFLAHAEPPGQAPAAEAGGADGEAAQVVWSYDTGG